MTTSQDSKLEQCHCVKTSPCYAPYTDQKSVHLSIFPGKGEIKVFCKDFLDLRWNIVFSSKTTEKSICMSFICLSHPVHYLKAIKNRIVTTNLDFYENPPHLEILTLSRWFEIIQGDDFIKIFTIKINRIFKYRIELIKPCIAG